MEALKLISDRLDRESGPMSRSKSVLLDLLLMERFRQLTELEEERFRQVQYEALRKEVEKGYRGNPTWTALAAKSARMFRDLESSIRKKPPYNFQEENPWPTVSGHRFGETSQPYCVNIIDRVRIQYPNLAGSSGFHFQQKEMTGSAEVTIDIPDEDDHHIRYNEFNSSTFGQDTALALYYNQLKPSNGFVKIEVLDEDDSLIGNPWMPNLGSGATILPVASSSGIDKFACDDDSESSTMAEDVTLGTHLNQPEASNEAATVCKMQNRDNNDPSHETKFRPDVNTILAAIAGQASVNLISSSSIDSSYVRLFAVASGIGFLGSFFAIYFLKKPKLAKVLSKIGAIGTASAVVIALGINVLKDTNWYLKVVGLVATAAGCLISAGAVVMAD